MALEKKKVIIKSVIILIKISLAITGDVTAILYYKSADFYTVELKDLMKYSLFSGFLV